MSEPRYTAQEQRARMRDFERWVKQARRAWKAGYAVVLLPWTEWFRLRNLDKPKRTRLSRPS